MKLTDFQEAFPDDTACMRFLEETVWVNGRHCPECGCLNTVPLGGKAAERHLYHCRDCHKQFTVTSGTWLHSRKLPLTKYFEILYYSVNSSFGMASTRISEWTGVSQKSVWKILQAFRELQGFWLTLTDKLTNTVEFDTKYVGGQPRKQKDAEGNRVKNKRGRGTKKQAVFVAAERQGEVRATVVPNEAEDTIRPLAEAQVDPQAHIMSDGDGTFAKIARSFALQSQCSHRDWDFSKDGVHNNTAESFNSWVEHMRDVHFFVSKDHMQRYVNDVMTRWNLRVAVEREVTQKGQRVRKILMEKMPLLDRLRVIFGHAVGCNVRRNRKTGGIMVVA
ncbi:transposase-like protein [Azospirillum lipoferum]|uniref:IS1595 family transposase n=1 Tax=Azospirillum lipoferum TaxID=193 RepID=A0A5A9GGU7_AZOLI|nr:MULTISPECIES: IS1595 family transposase [Azospirillum]KAA0592924.1 IS1595 family transposase [Azospirillum lipoferum]MCP1614024.1 transposase-like protein [Azospirillum lipoferum]MDW5537586.1 IS1595 family transposase [Azospirillum sp. NL1]